MKTLFRYYLINLTSLWVTTKIMGGLSYTGGLQTLLMGALTFAVINIVLVPLLKVLLLPLNLLTLGFFAWIVNVLALYVLTTLVRGFQLMPYHFPGFYFNGFTIPPIELTTFWVAVVASLMIGLITHFLQWLVH